MSDRLVVFDLDGVLRAWNEAATPSIESSYGLAPGSIEAAAFRDPLLEMVVTGAISKSEWLARIGDELESRDAVEAWAHRGYWAVDEARDLAQRCRRNARIAILTNGTSDLVRELRDADMEDLACVVFNSADIGIRKPDVSIYVFVVERLEVDASNIYYLDDQIVNVQSAASVGIRSHHYRDSALAAEFLEPVLTAPPSRCCDAHH
ncbi:MAG: HAD-IA family hydrolase [bacterium]|nr:HAD-IA family hydrolase [bacterium]